VNGFMNNLVRDAMRDREYTTQPLEQAAAEASTSTQCEFLRLPPPGQKCPITGLTRGFLNLLVLPCKENDFKPPVRSFSLRRKGRAKGVRLVDRADLVRYIREHVERGFKERDGES
jgi:hypothetical protein